MSVHELPVRRCFCCGKPGGSQEDPLPLEWMQLNAIVHKKPFRPVYADVCDVCVAELGGEQSIVLRGVRKL